jgi:hypothetical protein
VGNFSGVPGETDLLLRNNKTGGLVLYDINITNSPARPSSALSAWIGSSQA